MMAFSGVRNSWLVRARNSVFIAIGALHLAVADSSSLAARASSVVALGDAALQIFVQRPQLLYSLARRASRSMLSSARAMPEVASRARPRPLRRRTGLRGIERKHARQGVPKLNGKSGRGTVAARQGFIAPGRSRGSLAISLHRK